MRIKCVFIFFVFINLFQISCIDVFDEDDLITEGLPISLSLLHEAVIADDIAEVKRLLTEEGWKEFRASRTFFAKLDNPDYIKPNVNFNVNYRRQIPLFYVILLLFEF